MRELPSNTCSTYESRYELQEMQEKQAREFDERYSEFSEEFGKIAKDDLRKWVAEFKEFIDKYNDVDFWEYLSYIFEENGL